ncbi:MAG: CocE/NonD family hydrolase, partial [Actinobacteria bacterium]|nr:CocE/NonD family hydrolase [Actinomycetota bacterium]
MPGAVRADEFMVAMGDGTQLSTEVVTADDGEPRPTLLIRTPYSRIGARQADDAIGLARLGWSVVMQDARGTAASEGEWHPFRNERSDGADTVAWCAAQPWSDGRVAMWGASYVGITQLMAAAERPPALRAIAPMVTSAWADEGWTYEGGALQLGFAMPWAAMMAAACPRIAKRDLDRAAAVMADWPAAYRQPLGDHPVRALSPAFVDWLSADQRRVWKDLDIAKKVARADIPAFFVAGWYDLFCDGTLRTFASIEAPARIVVGPWTHAGLWLDTTPEVQFGDAANGIAQDVRGEALRWMRRAIDGEEVEGGARLFVMGVNAWREFDGWPPPSTPARFFLTDEASLQSSPPAEAGRHSFDYDPHNPVPTRGGRTLGPYLPMAGPVDQHDVEARGDVLVYTSAPLTKPLTVIGQVEATIRFSTTGRSADVTVKLVDVHPDGRALNVVDSVRRLPFTPGRPKNVDVAVGATAMCFLAGHRIRVEVSSSNFPRLDRNPSTGEHWGDATVLQGARQTVHLGSSRVTLPVTPTRRGAT